MISTVLVSTPGPALAEFVGEGAEEVDVVVVAVRGVIRYVNCVGFSSVVVGVGDNVVKDSAEVVVLAS